MKQDQKIARKKSKTNANKILFPFSQFTQALNQNQSQSSVDKKNKITFCSNEMTKFYVGRKQCERQMSLSRQKKERVNSLSRFVHSLSKINNVSEIDEISKQEIQTNKKNSNFLLVEIDNFKKYKHRSLSKQRSLTSIQQNSYKIQQSQISTKILKRVKKQRSLTKLQSQWVMGRQKQKQKQSEQLHKFDTQKIDRTYDHLGKLKKSTLNKGSLSKKFVSFKTITKETDLITKEIESIDKRVFLQAEKQFHKKFKNSQFASQSKPQETLFEHELKQQEEIKRIPSPQQAKKNFAMSPNNKKKEASQLKVKKGFKARASADEQFSKMRQVSEDIQNESKQNSFFSDINELKTFVNQQSHTIKSNHSKRLSQFSGPNNNFFHDNHQSISENSAQIIFDKVYFFSSRLSARFAELFSIEKINLKSKRNDHFVIEVVIKAYEQIVVQRIVYGKGKKSQAFRKGKVMSEKEEEKEKLKKELFSQMIAKKQQNRNRQSIPQSIDLNSQKQNMISNFQVTAFYHQQNANRVSIDGIRSDLLKEEDDHSKQSPSSMNISKVSSQCYQSLIEYIQKYCQLQVSYLGAFLKQSEHAVPILSQLMKKKHSQMQETLLQSLNLAKILYFLIKINTTYYTAKIVIMGDKKIKYYLLYEFSNMIRHQKHCIIEEEEDIKKEITKMRKKQLTAYLYHQTNRFFARTVARGWGNRPIMHLKGKRHNGQHHSKHHSDTHHHSNHNQTQNIPLLNALELCFGTIRQIGLACDIDSQSQRLYKITQSNYKNDVRWQKQEIMYGRNERYENFFRFHNAFDYELVPWEKKDMIRQGRTLFLSSVVESGQLQERLMYSQHFSYKISRKFDIVITLYPSAIKSKHQLVRLHPTRLRQLKLEDHFVKEQFLLLHLIQSKNTSYILDTFLKKQYIQTLTNKIRQLSTPFFTTLKNKKYYIEVFVPFLQSPNPWKSPQQNLMKESIFIQLQSRISVKRYSLQMTLEDVFDELKEYYRLCNDSRAERKFADGIRKVRYQMYTLPKDFFVQKLKFYVSKLFLMKKNTYSQFYFIPIADLISEASHRVSMMDQPKPITTQLCIQPSHHSNSFRATQKHTNLILEALKKMQGSVRQQQKSSRSTISRIKIKNFPVYEIYYKTTRRLIPGYFVIISIYYMPMFDVSQIKFYLTKVHKSFFVSIRKNIDPGQYQNIVMVLVEYMKDKFFAEIIAQETLKLSSKYKDFYSRMMRQAESAFISKTRKNKQTPGQALNNSSRRLKHIKRNYAVNEVEFVELTEELLCKVFQSRKHHKYLIRLSYPSTKQYVSECQRKGIDELINISICKQNCMLIYKFQTTARKLLSKKVTHKFNVIQLEYQQKNKPFYILFQEIKILIEESDQSTYGLLNTFRSYFLNKHYNTLTNNNFVSMLSINLIAGLSNNFLTSETNLLTLNKLNNPYRFDTQKEINLKDLNSSLYQRYCLFISGNQILQVLKIRKKAKFTTSNQSNTSMKYTSNFKTSSDPESEFKRSKEKKRSKTFERKKGRKQSIEAFLPSKDLLTSDYSSKAPNIRMVPPKNIKNNENENETACNPPSLTLSLPKKPKKIDFFIEDPCNLNSQTSQASNDSQRPNLEQKLVYLINTDTEYVAEIPSSSEDHGFAINVPFGNYNKKMFKRFFKNVIRKVGDYDNDNCFIKEDESIRESSNSAFKSVPTYTLLY